jgi:Saxitoxin biosynthesis operon protein SxtJ
MRWSDIQFDPTRRTLRQFAWLWLTVFGAMALWHTLVKAHIVLGLAMAALALIVGSLGVARPETVRFIYVGWMVLAFPIGWTVSQVMLALIFFGLFMPFGLVFRLIGRDPLQRRRRSHRKSYWEPKPTPTDLKRYFKQF